MARTYSAIMALLGMLVVVLRGIKDGAGLEGTIVIGLAWMAFLGAIGLIVGWIAQQTVDKSVREKIQAELTAFADQQPTQESTITV